MYLYCCGDRYVDYDMIYECLTCTEKLTSSQISLLHDAKTKTIDETRQLNKEVEQKIQKNSHRVCEVILIDEV